MLYDAGLSYRRTAIEGASPIGLVIALYDTLWGNLRRATEAIRAQDIEARCDELNHAMLVLGQLESWVAPENGGDLARSLTQFYRYLRAKMMEASATQSAKILEDLMDLILHVRSAWQQRDLVPHQASETSPVIQSIEPESSALDPYRIARSFSA
jgi:flagellar secretion chaperone FliS